MARHEVGFVSEVPAGARKIVEVSGKSIGIFNVHGAFYGLRNACPHQGGPLCLGSIKGMTMPSRPGEYVWAREGEILRCPWHGWEFDITTGQAICEPDRTRVRTYRVTVEHDRAADETADSQSVETLAAETYRVTVEEDRIILHT